MGIQNPMMSEALYEKYEILSKIGEGSFSEVYRCKNRENGDFFAAKRVKDDIYKNTPESINREIESLKRLNQHPNILGLMDFFIDSNSGRATLIFELMEQSLYDLIRNCKRYLTEAKVQNYVYQMLKGLNHIHSNGMFHRDIKPENILIKNNQIKIADMGCAKRSNVHHPYTEYISTRWYRSPECLLTTGYYGPKMDIWAVGCTFYELVTLRPLFPGESEVDQVSKIHKVFGMPNCRTMAKFKLHKSCNWETCCNTKGIGLDDVIPSISELGRSVMKQMLAYDPDIRENAKRLLDHGYFYHQRKEDVARLYRSNIFSKEVSPLQREKKNLINFRKRKYNFRQNNSEEECKLEVINKSDLSPEQRLNNNHSIVRNGGYKVQLQHKVNNSVSGKHIINITLPKLVLKVETDGSEFANSKNLSSSPSTLHLPPIMLKKFPQKFQNKDLKPPNKDGSTQANKKHSTNRDCEFTNEIPSIKLQKFY